MPPLLVTCVTHALRRLRRSPRVFVYVFCVLLVTVAFDLVILALNDGLVGSVARFPEFDQLVRIRRLVDPTSDGLPVSRAEYEDWRTQIDYVEFAALGLPPGVQRLDVQSPIAVCRLGVLTVTPNLFHVLRVPPTSGRLFAVADGHEGAAPSAVLSDTAARCLFPDGGNVIGTEIETPGLRLGRHTVVGTVSDSAQLYWPGRYDVYLPLTSLPPSPFDTARRAIEYDVVGRLSSGIDARLASTRLSELVVSIAAAHPGIPGAGAIVESFHEVEVGALERTLKVFAAFAGVITFVVVVHLIGVVAAATASRRDDLDTMYSLGASRLRLAVQVGSEVACAMSMAIVLSPFLAAALLGWLLTALPSHLPNIQRVDIDVTSVIYAAVLGLTVTTMVGASAAASSASPLAQPLGAVRHRRWMAIIPLVVQGLLVLAVLLPAAQTYLGYIRLQRAPLGFRPDDVVVANILVRDLQTDRERFLNFQRDVLTQLAAIPGVARVALSNSLPAAGEPPPNAGLYLDDHTLARAFVNTVSPGYFALLDIGLSKGRTFEEGAGRCQLVVNESFASRHRVSAGSTVRYAASTCDVIGVAANVPYRHDGAVAPTVYQSIRDGRIAGNLWAFVEAHGAVTSVIRNMPRAIQSAPGRARSVEVGLLQDHVRAATATTRLYATTGALPVVFALFLVAVSTFAAASLGIRLRFRACAISLALGATPRRLVVELGAPIVAAFTIATVFGLLGGQLIASALQERFVGIEVPSFTTALGAVLALWAIVAFAIVWLLILIGRIDLVRGMRAP